MEELVGNRDADPGEQSRWPESVFVVYASASEWCIGNRRAKALLSLAIESIESVALREQFECRMLARSPDNCWLL